MPRMDGTGPQGQGPMSGRGFGPCGGRMGWCGRGAGMGWRMPYRSPKNQQLALEEEEKMLEAELEEVRTELKSLNDQK